MKRKRMVFIAVIFAALAARAFIKSEKVGMAEAVRLINGSGIRAALAEVGRFSAPSDVIAAFTGYGEYVEIASVP